MLHTPWLINTISALQGIYFYCLVSILFLSCIWSYFIYDFLKSRNTVEALVSEYLMFYWQTMSRLLWYSWVWDASCIRARLFPSLRAVTPRVSPFCVLNEGWVVDKGISTLMGPELHSELLQIAECCAPISSLLDCPFYLISCVLPYIWKISSKQMPLRKNCMVYVFSRNCILCSLEPLKCQPPSLPELQLLSCQLVEATERFSLASIPYYVACQIPPTYKTDEYGTHQIMFPFFSRILDPWFLATILDFLILWNGFFFSN